MTTIQAADLELQASVSTDGNDLVYMGTEGGNCWVVAVTERSVRKCPGLAWKTVFPHAAKKFAANPVTAIRVHSRKPYRILVSYRFTGAVIWNLKASFAF